MSDATTTRHPARDRMAPDEYHAQRAKILADVAFQQRSCEAIAGHYPAHLAEAQDHLHQAETALAALDARWAAQKQPIAFVRVEGQLRLVLSDGSSLAWPGEPPAGLTEVHF